MLPGMATVELSAKERRRLEETFRTTTDRRLRDRVQAVLMATGDRTQAQIAADLLVSERSVRRWLQAWRAEGLVGLEIQCASSQPHGTSSRRFFAGSWDHPVTQGHGATRGEA